MRMHADGGSDEDGQREGVAVGEEEGDRDGDEALTYEQLQALGDVVGLVSRGLTPSRLERLPQQSFGALKRGGRLAGVEECEGGAGT